jgi:hypothetical protein
MNLKLMQAELEIVNSSNAFWQALDSNFSQASCGHDHGQGDEHFHMAGNFLIAQEKIREAIEAVFSESFNSANHEHRDHLITLAAIQKAQDQLSGGAGFVSQRTFDFKKHFKISESLSGIKFDGETFEMPNAKKYLVQKFNLSSTRAKADVIWASQEIALTKAGKLVDLGFKDAVDPLVEVAGSLYKAAPSLAIAGLALGTAQMVLRSLDDQESANKLRDNIGASTEAAAFFVLVNGVLENLSHSFILAAPAFATVAAYDSAYSKLKPIYDHFRPKNDSSQIEIRDAENGVAESKESEHEFAGSFKEEDSGKKLNILRRAKNLINEDGMWIGLRKHQLAYHDNGLEKNLKSGLESLIAELTANPTQINKLFQKDFGQNLRDSFEMIKAYSEVYEDKNPGSGVKQFLHEFCDHFACDAILLAEPSKEAKSAAFYCRSYNGLVSFEERVKESLPHMPTGQQVLLAATVIGALYSASAIYKSATGEEEVYSDYVTNFPDHLFEWLYLDQMYQNMGGGAEITESFKDFFAGFNLAENSTHLGIVVAPFAAYAQMGSKMFDGITHTPVNYLAYAADLTNSYVTATKTKIGGWLFNRSVAVAPDADISIVDVPNLISDKSTQTDFLKEEKSDEGGKVSAPFGAWVGPSEVARGIGALPDIRSGRDPNQSTGATLCGNLEQLLQAQADQKAKRDARRAARLAPIRGNAAPSTHVHGPNCGHNQNTSRLKKTDPSSTEL